MESMLSVTRLGISFGGLKAVDDFSMEIKKGQLYGLIGPNGAGKTTVFNLLTWTEKILPERRQSISIRRELPVLSKIFDCLRR